MNCMSCLHVPVWCWRRMVMTLAVFKMLPSALVRGFTRPWGAVTMRSGQLERRAGADSNINHPTELHLPNPSTPEPFNTLSA